jgi:hypothetical protein
MLRALRRLSGATAVFVGFLINVGLTESASAHVKWFCAYDVAGQPEGLENVLCPDFEFLVGLSVLSLLVGALLEDTPVGSAMLRALDRATHLIRDNVETILRCAVAFFFIAIWGVGGVLLTPELKSTSSLVGAIQLGIAAGMVSRRTMPLSALGVFTLYGVAIWNYGLFHLADYPVFLGVSIYLAMAGFGLKDLWGDRPIDILRWFAGITLMWASIEKWAYPEWSYPLFIEHPGMSLGFSPEFYMRAAGAVEFALAFALFWTPLVRRIGATMLAAMFVSAVFAFGKIDLIGHTLIVVALFAIVADDGGRPARLRDTVVLPLGYVAALVLFLAAYYVGHAELFGTAIL